MESSFSASAAAWELFTDAHLRADQANGGTTTAANRLRLASAITLTRLCHRCATLAFASWSSLVVFLLAARAFCLPEYATSNRLRRKIRDCRCGHERSDPAGALPQPTRNRT